MITIDMCLAGRDISEPRLGPDGTVVAFATRWGNSAALATVPIGGGPERLVTTAPAPSPGRGLGGGCFDWCPDGRSLVYVGGDGNLWHQPLPGGPPRRVTELADGRRAEAPSVASDGASVVAMVDQAEIWRWPMSDLGTPDRLDDGTADFVFDPRPMPVSGAGWIWQAWNVPDMAWDAARAQHVVEVGGDRERGEVRGRGAIQQIGHHPDGRMMCVRDDTGWSVVWLGDEPLVDEPFEHAGPTWGPGQRSYAVSPDGARIAFARNERGFGRLCIADVASRAVSEVARGVHGQLSWAGERVTALRTGARTPTQIVAYDTTDWTRTVLAVGAVTAWDTVDLPEPELVEVERDGSTLHARRYVAGHGRTLCWVHGGPTDQWQVEFLPRIAYWWSRGWDVLVPDPRGTSGHGRRYQQALHGEWGRLDVDDTAAIVRSSHERGWSAPDRTVMMGSSSGGLTALGVLGLHAGLAAGGVVLYPVTDLVVLAKESHRFEAHYTHSLIGPLDQLATYRERSPISYADRIDVPVLVMHGDSDPVVPLSSTIEFASRMRAAGGDVELAVFEGEGHGLRAPEHRRADLELTERFLTRVVR